MRIEIKLYSYHDLDLVSLYKTGRIAFPETTRQVLNSYARKEVYKVRPLPLNENRAAKYPQKMYRKSCEVHSIKEAFGPHKITYFSKAEE